MKRKGEEEKEKEEEEEEEEEEEGRTLIGHAQFLHHEKFSP